MACLIYNPQVVRIELRHQQRRTQSHERPIRALEHYSL